MNDAADHHEEDDLVAQVTAELGLKSLSREMVAAMAGVAPGGSGTPCKATL